MQTAVSQRCAAGESLCGDGWAVVEAADATLLAVIDGLGHGPEAHQAAQAARATIERRGGLELEPLVAELGAALRDSRGACLGLARVDHRLARVRCAIVGNVEIVGLGRAPIRPLPSPGIVGRALRKLRVCEALVSPGDRLFLYSDGISRRVELARYGRLGAQLAAEAVVRDFGVAHDDATCLVADL